jgi:hypothetical protein
MEALTTNYNIIPTYNIQTKEHTMMLNVAILLFIIIMILIIIYIMYYSGNYKIRVNVT